jgi:hypothetical protein
LRFRLTNIVHACEIDPVLGAEEKPMPQDLLEERQQALYITEAEVTEGLYCRYHFAPVRKSKSDVRLGVSGELIRLDNLEGTQGIKLNLDINVIDVTTRKPVLHIFVEL